MKYTKIFLVIILVILAGIGLFNSMFDLAILSIGYPVGYMIYSGIYLRYILFIIPLVFVLRMCVSALKKIYIHGSIVSGIITGFIMLWYLSCNYYSVLLALYFSFMSILCFAIAIYLMVKILPKADEKMLLLAGLMKGLDYKKKFKVALLLLEVCIICVFIIRFE